MQKKANGEWETFESGQTFESRVPWLGSLTSFVRKSEGSFKLIVWVIAGVWAFTNLLGLANPEIAKHLSFIYTDLQRAVR